MLGFGSSAEANQLTFKHFSDYKNIEPTKHSDPAGLRAHYWAKEKIIDRPEDPTYKKNTWKLVMRRGIYLSEVDKAMSEIYQLFLGYSTDVDMVEENGDYFIARREFKHFNVFEDDKDGTGILINKKGNQFYLKDYLIMNDGSLIAGNTIKHLTGLAKIAVLTNFFGESDAETFNYGIQETDTELRAIQFDNEHAFTFNEERDNDDHQYPDIEKVLAEKLGPEFIQMTWFQKEKQNMLEKIANTDFSIIERIIRKNITVSQLDEARWTLTKILKDPTVMPDYDRKEAQKELDNVNAMDESKYGVEQIIQELKARHQKLRERLN